MDLSNVVNTSHMFENCKSLKNLPNFNFHLAKISFSEWYANMKIDFLFLKKDINKTLNKIDKYL